MPHSPLADIDFTIPQLKRRKNECSDGLTRAACSKAKIPEQSAKELNVLYRTLSEATKPALLLSLVPGYSDPYIPLCLKGILPKPLPLLFNKDYLYLNILTQINVKRCLLLIQSHQISAKILKKRRNNRHSQRYGSNRGQDG